MSDPRSTPNPEWVSQNTKAQVIQPVADLNRNAGNTRDRQVLFGEQLTVLGQVGTHSYVITDKDNYVGFIASEALGAITATTHRVSALATQAYAKPKMKSPDQITLHHGSKVMVISANNAFCETAQGFIPSQHLTPADQPNTDPIKVAKLYLGTPYLWGGNSRLGLDCSGLVQAALNACDIPCPGDSDQQEAQLGTALPANTPAQKGDLFFWKGHVAMAIDDKTLIHANAHHMAVAYELIEQAIKRINDQGDGPVTAHKRL